MTQLILASSSPYRKELLQRLRLDFICINPDIDEAPKTDEPAQKLVTRLAEEKANRVSEDNPKSWIIGSDQCASFEGKLIGKPGTVEAAENQLRAFSGKEVCFYTSVCLLNREANFQTSESTQTLVRFRELTDEEISVYIETDNPIDCAGSFKAESLGISLFREIESSDPTALIGLPLIKLSRLLRKADIL